MAHEYWYSWILHTRNKTEINLRGHQTQPAVLRLVRNDRSLIDSLRPHAKNLAKSLLFFRAKKNQCFTAKKKIKVESKNGSIKKRAWNWVCGTCVGANICWWNLQRALTWVWKMLMLIKTNGTKAVRDPVRQDLEPEGLKKRFFLAKMNVSCWVALLHTTSTTSSRDP